MKRLILLLVIAMFSSWSLKAQKDSTVSAFVSQKISIAGIEKGEIEKSKILSSKGLEFLNESFAGYKIIGYKLTLGLIGQGLLEFDTNTGELSPQMKEAIRESPAGTKLFFEYIRCLDPEGHNKPVLPTEFVLK